MTRRMARNKKNSETIRRRKFSGMGLYKRRSVGMKKYLMIQIQGRRSPQLSIKAAPVSSWICTNTSWTNMKTVDMTTFEFSSESASSPIFEDFGNDEFLGECMLVYNVWIWVMEQSDCDLETTYSDDEDYATVYSNCNTSCTECDMAELFEWMDQWTNDEILQENMKLFTEWTTVNDEEEVMVEEETKKILMGTPPSKKSSSSESIYDNHHPIVPSGWIDSIRDSLPTTHAFNSDVSSSSSDSFTDSSISESESEDKIDSILRTAPTTRITANTNGVFDEVSSSSSTSDNESGREPVVLKKITTVSSSTQAATQTSTVRALAECDELLEKLMEIRKKLEEMI
ncbi:hypothetical protein PRIPAC_72252 [Pristionchus pacificus]|uniref:Uncharacterized protein n=1 Tax=Pristionchus pacificus TaxID=54126 RepID=A0A2A6C9K8_PRIPA|nr:hypothetical protein PRIPAC_72252 [Pristionchus pacificus]|eukprot:PDM74895.1 hypothetical protein PRIPAC_40276 [Pristionchus pacificus]